MDFPKVFYCIFKMAHLTPALLTPALINATPKNNAELGPALKWPIRYFRLKTHLNSYYGNCDKVLNYHWNLPNKGVIT